MTRPSSKKSPIRPLPRRGLNGRQRTLTVTVLAALFIAAALFGGMLMSSGPLSTHLESRNLAPSFTHLFGTDWLGRDMFTRTVKGLALSIRVGLIAAAGSVGIAALLGFAAATLGRTADRLVSWLIDLFLSVPHLVSLILIAFVFGGGLKGVVIGIACTHWPSLARVIRAEVLQLRSAEYVQISRRLGKSRVWVATRHMLPHVLPQLFVGMLLLFPHAILHEAAITFLGLGLSPHQPAIGIILSESMRYLSTGMWWLAVFPGLCLLITVRAFGRIGENLRGLSDPDRSHK
ncbi:ABC transporter permease [Paenibacillus sp. MBLB4367]|uniref:ABC transporter permease n=1 Tax=Paenibacillus sp. MBLB4367 TaxID=3384767 RepID=UPI0039080DEB